MSVKTCARCGKRLPVSRPRVYSHFSGVYYCATFADCAKRAARRHRKVAA